jgi:hypothetical protein
MPPPRGGYPRKSAEIRGTTGIFNIAKHRQHRNTSSSPAFGGARRFAPPLLVLRHFRYLVFLYFFFVLFR